MIFIFNSLKINGMEGKERIFSVFNGRSPDRIVWVPFAGVHAGKLKGYNAREVLTDPEKLFSALIEVKNQYHPDGMPVMFDLQIEAEILGCKLKWMDKSPPVVKDHPLKDDDGAKLDLLIEKINKEGIDGESGRLPVFLNVMKRIARKLGEEVALFGQVTGPLTLATHLRGTSLYMDLLRNKEYASKLIDFCSNVCKIFARYYASAGMDIIAIVDPVVSQISPRIFRKFLSETFKQLFSFIKGLDKYNSLFVCGDATKNIRVMCETGPDSIFIDENVDMIEAGRITSEFGIVLGGNIPLTRVLLHGTQFDNMKFVIDHIERLADAGLNPKQFIIAPGCDMPYDVPPENVIGLVQAIQDPDHVKKALESYSSEDREELSVELPDYDNLNKPLIEVFTIDSDTCAACGYMVQLALTAKEKFGDRVDLVEYKALDRETFIRAKKLGVMHLPSIVINGKVEYSSIIPPKDEYLKKIEDLLR